MTGKKQEAWSVVAASINPNPLFAGRLTATTARDKYEEMKAYWMSKNRTLLAPEAEAIVHTLSEYDRLFRELAFAEAKIADQRKAKRHCAPKAAGRGARAYGGMSGAAREGDVMGMGPEGLWGGDGYAGTPAGVPPEVNFPVADSPAMAGAFAKAILLIDCLLEQGSLTPKQARKLRFLCMWQKPPLAVLIGAYGENAELFAARCKELLEGDP